MTSDEGSSGRRGARPAGQGRPQALFLTLMMLAGCSAPPDGFLAAAGPIAASQRWHFFFVLACMAVVILPLFLALPVVLWRYRHGGGRGAYRPRWEVQRVLEYLIWLVPVAVVLVMAVVLWRQTHDLDPYAPIASEEPPLEVRVISMDWKFLFLYPEQGVASLNRLVVPAGRPLRFELTSATVMQSFMVPRLGGQIYAMGGMVTELNLMADAPGLYRGQNTQYNGRDFPDQKFDVEARPESGFEEWVAETRDAGRQLDRDAYDELAVPSTMEPRRYASYAPGLFEDVVASSRAPVAWIAR